MMRQRERVKVRPRDDSGFTLVELMVASSLLIALLAVFTGAANVMFKDVRRQTGQGNNLDDARTMFNQFDKQIRYANAINTPGTAPDGNTYIEWRSGNTSQQQTCVQWRYVPSTKVMAYRTWQPPLYIVGSAVTPGPWVQKGTGVTLPTSGSIFGLGSNVGGGNAVRQQLTVGFTLTHGVPSVSTSTSVIFTALNTPSASTPTTPVCQEVPRS